MPKLNMVGGVEVKDSRPAPKSLLTKQGFCERRGKQIAGIAVMLCIVAFVLGLSIGVGAYVFMPWWALPYSLGRDPTSHKLLTHAQQPATLFGQVSIGSWHR